MLFIQSKYVGIGDGKSVLTNSDINFLLSQSAKYLQLSDEELDNEVSLELDETATRSFLRPTKKYFITESDYISFISLLPDNQTVLTTECEETGDYKTWYIPSEWK